MKSLLEGESCFPVGDKRHRGSRVQCFILIMSMIWVSAMGCCL